MTKNASKLTFQSRHFFENSRFYDFITFCSGENLKTRRGETSFGLCRRSWTEGASSINRLKLRGNVTTMILLSLLFLNLCPALHLLPRMACSPTGRARMSPQCGQINHVLLHEVAAISAAGTHLARCQGSEPAMKECAAARLHLPDSS